MKKFNILAVLSMVLFSCVCLCVTSCSKYEEIEEIMEQNNPPQNPDNGDDNGNDENNEPEGDWGTIIEKTYGYLGEDQWPSTIKLQKSDGSEVVFKVNLPFTLTEWTDEYLTTEDETPSEFVEVCEADTACTAWSKDSEGNYLRKVTRTQSIKFKKFTRTITSESWEAYRFINGKEEYFKTGNTTLSFNPYSGHSQELTEVTKDGIKYEREANLVNATIKFHTESYELSAYTYIDREIGENGGDDNGNDNGDDNGGNNDGDEPEMPEADKYFDDIVKVSEITCSPIYVAKDKVNWYRVSFVETSDEYIIYVDGKYNDTWKKSELYVYDKYDSAVYNPTLKRWMPAVLTDIGTEWKWAWQFSDGSYDHIATTMNVAVSSGIKNLAEDNNAKVTPRVKTVIVDREYSGKKWYQVNGYNIDNQVTITYTVAEK